MTIYHVILIQQHNHHCVVFKSVLISLWLTHRDEYNCQLRCFLCIADSQRGFPRTGDGGRVRDQNARGDGFHRNHWWYPLPPHQLCSGIQWDGGSKRTAADGGWSPGRYELRRINIFSLIQLTKMQWSIQTFKFICCRFLILRQYLIPRFNHFGSISRIQSHEYQIIL